MIVTPLTGLSPVNLNPVGVYSVLITVFPGDFIKICSFLFNTVNIFSNQVIYLFSI